MRQYLKGKSFLYLIAALVLIFCLSGFSVSRQVSVDCDGVRRTVQTKSKEPPAIIAEAGFEFSKGDSWTLDDGGQNIHSGSVIQVRRGMPFTLHTTGGTQELRTSKTSVGDALKEQGLDLAKRTVYPDKASAILPGEQIYLLDAGEELVESVVATDPGVRYVEDKYLTYGVERELEAAIPGRDRVYSAVRRYADGSGRERELFRVVLDTGAPRLVRKGLARTIETPEGNKRYYARRVMEATAYIATGNPTSCGVMPYVGVVAVDPDVIPYYTKMFIPGYGLCQALDTGGDIVGNRVDLFMDTYDEAINFGRRNVEVYLLEDD